MENGLAALGIGAGSKNETLKIESNFLRGSLADEFASDAPAVSEDALQLLKFHGSYQQDDRDLRAERTKAGLGRAYSFMIRTRIPGGVLTGAQYLAHDVIADQYANGTVRFTTRQGIQLHGVLKGDLKPTVRAINDALLTTLAACGDVNRNVMACPAPLNDPVRHEIQAVAHAIAERLTPRTGAYHELWLDGEKLDRETLEPIDRDAPAEAPKAAENEPLYGPTYLPRKFKIGIAAPGDNCIDVYTQDIGLVAEVADGKLAGFTVLAGGGMGMTHGKKETHPRLASALCFAPKDEVLDIVETIVTIQRDHGDRKNRKHSRMKYLVEDRGVAWFHEELERRLGRAVAAPHDVTFDDVDDHLGWHQQAEGTWFLGLLVENGRVKDAGNVKFRTALRTLVERFNFGVHVTGQQNVLITGIADEQRLEVDAILAAHGVKTDPKTLGLHRDAMACPALPTCGLALTDAERALPAVVSELEADLTTLGFRDERLSVRMTGCPNGCARPYMGDIGFVGRSKDLYDIFIGGDWGNTRLNWVYRTAVRRNELATTLRPLFVAWRDLREHDESFGDFCERVGPERLQALTVAVA